MNEPSHLDLFSGIGGFALAAAWAGFRTVAFCEIDAYCQKVIKARFGAVNADFDWRRQQEQQECDCAAQPKQQPSLRNDTVRPFLWRDIQTFNGRRYLGVDLLTAGVPCQPASCAGKRRGRADDRWLWPEALRILGEAKPTWVVFENPTGILTLESGVVFESLLSQMEGLGYEVLPPLVIPACAVRAGHRRNRVFVVANLAGSGCGKESADTGRSSEGSSQERTKQRLGDSVKPAADVVSHRTERRRAVQRDTQSERSSCEALGHAADAESEQARSPGLPRECFRMVWPETDFGLLRTVHGLSRGMDRNRRARIHAIGNSVVSAQVYPILKAIRNLI